MKKKIILIILFVSVIVNLKTAKAETLNFRTNILNDFTYMIETNGEKEERNFMIYENNFNDQQLFSLTSRALPSYSLDYQLKNEFPLSFHLTEEEKKTILKLTEIPRKMEDPYDYFKMQAYVQYKIWQIVEPTTKIDLEKNQDLLIAMEETLQKEMSKLESPSYIKDYEIKKGEVLEFPENDYVWTSNTCEIRKKDAKIFIEHCTTNHNTIEVSKNTNAIEFYWNEEAQSSILTKSEYPENYKFSIDIIKEEAQKPTPSPEIEKKPTTKEEKEKNVHVIENVPNTFEEKFSDSIISFCIYSSYLLLCVKLFTL